MSALHFRMPIGKSLEGASGSGDNHRAPVFHPRVARSEEHTSELQSLRHLVCRLLLEKKKAHSHAKMTCLKELSSTTVTSYDAPRRPERSTAIFRPLRARTRLPLTTPTALRPQRAHRD